jgi:hypothetical protein
MLKLSIYFSPAVAIFIINNPLLKYFFATHPLTLKDTNDSSSFIHLIRYFRYGSNSGKLTYPYRFSDIDLFLLDYIKNNDYVHDVGSSTGVTSLELYNTIVSSGLAVNFSFSDKYLFLRYDPSSNTLYDTDNNFINCIFCGILVDPHLNFLFFLSRLLSSLLSYKRFTIPSTDTHLISLLNPEIRMMADQQNITYYQHDIFVDSSKQHHFVRCMNVLNPSYFSQGDLRAAALKLKSMLYPGGYILIGRTSHNGKNNASLFILDGSRFKLVADYNNGSEISSLVLTV